MRMMKTQGSLIKYRTFWTGFYGSQSRDLESFLKSNVSITLSLCRIPIEIVGSNHLVFQTDVIIILKETVSVFKIISSTVFNIQIPLDFFSKLHTVFCFALS